LAISVLDGWDVRLAEGALDESEDERRFADSSGTENDHPVVVTLFRHGSLLSWDGWDGWPLLLLLLLGDVIDDHKFTADEVAQ
jgi:hypothetical protein